MNKLFVLAAVLCLTLTAWGYEGYSPIATGGAGGTTIHVTNLNDSGSGSLRAAVLQSGARIIVFDVGGSICVASEIRITSGNVTIDGSTAPSPGITLVGSGFYAVLGMNVDDVSGNVIVSHIRIRNSGKEGIQIWGGGVIVVDHCSVTGSLDGAFDINAANHVVISRCLFGGNVEVHKAHGTYVSAHHNLYGWNNRRQPRVFQAGPCWDFRNNIVEFWTNTGTNILYSDAVNVINNWYGDPSPEATCSGGFYPLTSDTNVYINGNYSHCGQNIDGLTQTSIPNTEPGVTTTDATTAYNSVLADCGAQPTDSIDQYYINGGGTNPPAVGSCGGGGSGGGGSSEASFLSDDVRDGYVRESSETSGVGDYAKSTNSWIGDDTSKRQYVTILSFDTSSLPDSATITSATLTIRRLGKKGAPDSTLGALTADIKSGTYGSITLQITDFEAASSATNVVTLPFPTGNGDYSTGSLNSTGRGYINKSGYTQFKVHFAVDDDNDAVADYLDLYDNNYNPLLEVYYQ